MESDPGIILKLGEECSVLREEGERMPTTGLSGMALTCRTTEPLDLSMASSARYVPALSPVYVNRARKRLGLLAVCVLCWVFVFGVGLFALLAAALRLYVGCVKPESVCV